MPFPQLLSQLGQVANTVGTNLLTNRLLNRQGVNVGGIQLPNMLAGGGLLLGGSLLDREPGEIQEARQSVRNLLTPESQTGQFTSYVKGFQDQFQPLLTQQRQRGIEDISQRFAAAFPKTVGAQGPEFGALSRYITDEALPREQAFLGQLGQQGITNQLSAGRTLLESNKPDPFASAISQLGGLLLAKDIFGGQGGNQLLGQNGQLLGTVDPTTGQLVSSGATGITSQLAQAVGLANTSGDTSQLVSLLASGALRGMPFPLGLQASTPARQIIQQAINAGLVESPAAQAVGSRAAAGGFDAGLAGPGLLGPAGTTGTGLLSSAASAGGSFLIGRAIGQRFAAPDSTASGFKAAGGGAAGGAATGFAVGGPIGAVIGAIAGGIGGIFGERSARHERKEGQIAAEAQQTAQFRPQALATIEDLDANAKQYPQMKAVADSLVPQVHALLQARDPEMIRIVRELQALYPQAGGQLFSASGVPLPPTGTSGNGSQETPHGAFLMEKLAQAAFMTGVGIEENRHNPESVVGRLFSGETGKFNSAFETIQRSLETTRKAQVLWAQLLQRVGA